MTTYTVSVLLHIEAESAEDAADTASEMCSELQENHDNAETGKPWLEDFHIGEVRE